MLIRHRKLYDDWHSAEQRMAGARINEGSYVVRLTKGVIVVALALILLWFLWNITETNFIPVTIARWL